VFCRLPTYSGAHHIGKGRRELPQHVAEVASSWVILLFLFHSPFASKKKKKNVK